MNERDRCIRLRRPPVLSIVDEPFVPEADIEEIDRRWETLCKRNPAYFDGRILQTLGVHRNGHGGASIHVADCAYRFWAVQDGAFDLGVRPLGVKGITIRDGRVLLGLRSMDVAGYPGQWEFAPGGVVEPGRDPAQVVLRELREETGFTASAAPTAIAILHDGEMRCWELVYRLKVERSDDALTREYQELRWCTLSSLPHPLSPIARRIAPLVAEGD